MTDTTNVDINEMSDAIDNLDDALNQPAEHIDRTEIQVSNPDIGYLAPWDRQPDETGEMYNAFLDYRDQGLSRTFTETSRQTGHSDRTIFKWGKEHDWRSRVQSWDNEQERLYQLARGEAIREMADRHAQMVQDALEILAIPGLAIQQRINEEGLDSVLAELSEQSLSKLIDTMAKTARIAPSLMNQERLTRGMPTAITVSEEVQHHTFDMDDNQLDLFLEALNQARISQLPSDTSAESADGEIVEAEVVEFHSLPGDSDD